MVRTLGVIQSALRSHQESSVVGCHLPYILNNGLFWLPCGQGVWRVWGMQERGILPKVHMGCQGGLDAEERWCSVCVNRGSYVMQV